MIDSKAKVIQKLSQLYWFKAETVGNPTFLEQVEQYGNPLRLVLRRPIWQSEKLGCLAGYPTLTVF